MGPVGKGADAVDPRRGVGMSITALMKAEESRTEFAERMLHAMRRRGVRFVARGRGLELSGPVTDEMLALAVKFKPEILKALRREAEEAA